MAPPASGEQHLVTTAEMQARLTSAAAERAANQATVARLLSAPVAPKIASLLGSDIQTVGAAAATLTDAELRDLAVRAELLTSDPVAGGHAVRNVLIVLGIALVVLIVIVAVGCSENEFC
jgi:hypothetical protein